MKGFLQRLLPLLLSLLLLVSLSAPALAEEPASGDGRESIIDEEALDQWFEDYRREHNLNQNWQDLSVGFCYTATGDCWFFNPDKFMYSASMYKVPVSMLLAEKEAAGQLSQDSQLPGGTLQYLETSALIYSNNDSGHAMVDYLGGTYSGKASDQCMVYTDLPRSYFEQDFFDYSYYSARFMTQVMQTLCEGGEERFPHIISCLLQAQPDSYLNLRLKGVYDVAQKYGAFTERNNRNNNHIAAIVYTPTPIVVVVMTRDIGEYQDRMAEIGEYLANYSLELDRKLAEREAQAPQTEASDPLGLSELLENTGAAAQEFVEGEPPGVPEPHAPETDAPVSGAPGVTRPQSGVSADRTHNRPYVPGAQIEGGRESLMPAFYVMIGAALLLLGYLAYLRLTRKTPAAAGSSRSRARH